MAADPPTGVPSPHHPPRAIQAALAGAQQASDARLSRGAPLAPLLESISPLMSNASLVAQIAKRHADAGDAEAAEAIMRALVATSPPAPGPWYALARLVHLGGNAEEARTLLERALALDPDHAPSLALLAGVLHYTEADPVHIRGIHERVGALVSRGISPLPPRPRRSSGRLRIGYMSGDFREHSVSWFVRSLLEHHDRDRFDVWCYSTALRPLDGVTDSLRATVERRGGTWRPCERVSDEDLARLIRADEVDILFELNGLTEGNRLRVLAMRPAPLQITAIGYPGTTGLRAIDARLVDDITDPPGTDASCVETLVRLDRCFLCYAPPADAPEPSREPGPPSFCSFNSLFKFGPRTLDLFAQVLRAAPDARLILKNQLLDPPFRRARLADAFASRGIDPARLEILGKIPGVSGHLGAYARADIALDTFPYNGTTTTCEALWMGVPVVSLKGTTHASRVGASLLAAAGRPDLVCASDDAFVARAVEALSAARASTNSRSALRAAVAASPLCDGSGHARAVERALESLWIGSSRR